MSKSRHAVLLVHGQGEQRSMEMGPCFVEHVFQADFDPSSAFENTGPRVHIAAETQSEIDDLRRLEVRFDDDRPDMDVFEFYWAPTMASNSLAHFHMWFFGLLRRPAREIPKKVRRFHRAARALVWALLLLTLFYLYVTAAMLFPVQIIQIAEHGLWVIFEFSLDWRLVVFNSAAILLLASLWCAISKRYEWCVSFAGITMALCLVSPLAVGATERITEDIEWVDNQGLELPNFNIWGAKIDGEDRVRNTPILSAAAKASRYLCDVEELPEKVAANESPDNPKGAANKAREDSGDFDPGETSSENDEETAIEARSRINERTRVRLEWSDMLPNRGVQLKDICLVPVALANPVLFARVADNAHTLMSGIIVALAALFYCIWRIFLRTFLVNIMGGSARYLNNHPQNNAACHAIRQSGVKLLDALHKTNRYDRIFIIAHSLGSVVAYDILRQYWGHVSQAGCTADASRLEMARSLADQVRERDADGPIENWRAAQSAVFDSLPTSWCVSDFITLGSPLSHGRLLLEGSANAPHLSDRFSCQRDLTGSILACPPVARDRDPAGLDEAELFLAVRWTNLFFDDDMVGGNVARDSEGLLFGNGIKDMEFSSKEFAAPGLSHNSYWMSKVPPLESGSVPWLDELRLLLGVKPPA